MMAHDYSKAYEWLKKAYEDGCSDSIKELGECYYYGKGTDIDYEKAFELFKESGNNIMLMECYAYGRGVKSSIEAVFCCFRNDDFKIEAIKDNKILYQLGKYIQEIENTPESKQNRININKDSIKKR
jgi:hypothetical protein